MNTRIDEYTNNRTHQQMRIIIFDGTFKTTAFINRLITGLVKSGHEVFVMGFNEFNPNPIKQVTYVGLGSNQHKISFLKTALKWGLTSGKFLQRLKLLLKGDKHAVHQLNIAAALDQVNPDIVHLQWVSNIPLFESFLSNSKFNFILSHRGYQTNVRPFVDAENFNYLQEWLPKFSGFHSVSKAISERGDVIATSSNKIDHVVYTGLDLSQFIFNDGIANNDVFRIVSVGRAHWKKGYDIAIKALKFVKDAQIDFIYEIVGAGMDEELLFLIDDLGLKDHVKLLSNLPQKKVFALMNQANVFLLPSLEEGIANVAVEAMALGCPVISTNCGGMEELITHDKEGWIVPVYDVEALSQQIIDFSQLPLNKIQEVVEAARTKVELQHNEEQMVHGMLQLYHKVI
jgi:colanic acid/amylovoran biosynthesis glycosyltransferase